MSPNKINYFFAESSSDVIAGVLIFVVIIFVLVVIIIRREYIVRILVKKDILNNTHKRFLEDKHIIQKTSAHDLTPDPEAGIF